MMRMVENILIVLIIFHMSDIQIEYVHNALVNQNLKMNTNTRYLYNIINEYSDRMLKTFPKKLNKIFFVCTGSEANDLALRIAKTYTKAHHMS